ncbi:peptidase S28 [Schizophyllum amplum]|uniref:Peptidase S28 n=1 Tax=Schizophyllum amplum TaxID=97359 RepID=A0A550CK99_9AGAR|nr:peptidase S28 [Auriculariopsis ampla]
MVLLGIRSLFTAALLALSVRGKLPDGRAHLNVPPHSPPPLPPGPPPTGPVTHVNGSVLADISTVYYLDIPVDHNDASLGTFSTRYWVNYEYYEPGGPIIFMNMGEVNAEGYTHYITNSTINGMIAQQESGLLIIMEHRFYGESNPFPNLNEDSLWYLTIEQAIQDNVYFARNVKLDVDIRYVPRGALTAFQKVAEPDVFYIHYGSSAVIQTQVDFHEYFTPIRQNMPANCSADVQAVIAYIDEVFMGTNETAMDEIKETFGYDSSYTNYDVAGSLRNNVWAWQSLQPYTQSDGGELTFYEFCDALEVKGGEVSGPEGWGVDYALPAWGAYFSGVSLAKICGDVDLRAECVKGTAEEPADHPVDDAGRAWTWQTCTQFGWGQIGAPEGEPTIVSRLTTVETDVVDYCAYYFPENFPDYGLPRTNETNARYGGWTMQGERMIFGNGNNDTWREASMSAQQTDIPVSTVSQPIFLGNGFHCSEVIARASVDPTVAQIQQQILEIVGGWLGDWDAYSEERRRKRET